MALVGAVPWWDMGQELGGLGPIQVELMAPPGGVPWWDILGGLGTLFLGLAALYAAFVSFRQYLTQRRRETTMDLVKLQADLVEHLRREWERAKDTPAEAMRREELEAAADVYEGMLRGVMKADPALSKAAREAVSAHLSEAISEREKLRQEER